MQLGRSFCKDIIVKIVKIWANNITISQKATFQKLQSRDMSKVQPCQLSKENQVIIYWDKANRITNSNCYLGRAQAQGRHFHNEKSIE